MKVKINKDARYEFEGLVFDYSLTADQQAILGDVGELDIAGDYTVEWDDDIPMVMVESVYLINNGKEIEVTDDSLLDLIADAIQERDDGSWAEDALGSRIDRAMDSLYDR